MKFKLESGNFYDGKTRYVKGGIVESDSPLHLRFRNKFTLITNEAPKVQSVPVVNALTAVPTEQPKKTNIVNAISNKQLNTIPVAEETAKTVVPPQESPKQQEEPVAPPPVPEEKTASESKPRRRRRN